MPATYRHRFGIGLLLALVALGGCVTNPVTGKSELRLVSTAQQIQIGQQNYAPLLQSQGGALVVDDDLQNYVNNVGQRLAVVSDLALPYEFTVLNNSVPNAWALPGGKIAINRGLLTELNSESELAAVLGHEIVHAAAGHGAQAQTRAIILQGGILATAIAANDSDYANIWLAGANIGAQLINQRYGRGAELESDRYGMEYMARAGYNPAGAVDLQQTFVRLSEGRPNRLAVRTLCEPPAIATTRYRKPGNGGRNRGSGPRRQRRWPRPLHERNGQHARGTARLRGV